MKIFIASIILIHGLIHFMGFAKAFQLTDMPVINHPVSKSWGLLWLFAGIIFSIVLVLFFKGSAYFWITALAAVCISQFLIIREWNDAKWGTLANILILLSLFFSYAKLATNSLTGRYNAEINKRLVGISNDPVLTVDDIKHLPKPVQDYLQYNGAIGQPQIKNMRVVFKGEMKNTLAGNWRPIRSEQYNFFDDATRVFYIHSKIYGIPFEGLHMYGGGKATMQIKIASLFKVVNAGGDKMNQSETVTYFNDMCLLAPATLISRNITWESLDPLTVKARFTQFGISISAILSFNESGELINFISDDRYLSEDGKNYQKLRWSTPILQYKDMAGRKLMAKARACWHTEAGEFSYANFSTEEIDYNNVYLKS